MVPMMLEYPGTLWRFWYGVVYLTMFARMAKSIHNQSQPVSRKVMVCIKFFHGPKIKRSMHLF